MRWIFRMVGALALLAVLAVAALFLLPTDRIAAIASQQLEAATGRSLTLEGGVRPTLWPELGITTGPVTLSNAPGFGAKPMLAAKGLSIGVDTAALWGGAIRITRVELIAPTIRLELDAAGRGNWEMTGAAADNGPDADASVVADTAGPKRAISLEKALISDGRLVFFDGQTGTRLDVSAIDATARLDALDGPAKLQLSAEYQGQGISLDGDVVHLSDFLSNGASGTTLRATVGGSTFDFDGLAGLTPMAAGGAVEVDLADQAAVFGLLGMAPPDLPEGLGQRIRVQADATYTDTGVTLRNAAIQLDGNTLTGDIDLVLGDPRPKVTARLNAGTLDLSSLAPTPAAAGDGGGAAAATGAGWSTAPIDVSGLQALDADISFVALGLDLGLIELGATRLRTTLDAGRAVTNIGEMQAYGGTIGGSFVINSRGGLSARSNLAARQVAIQPLLADLAGFDRLIATGDVALNLLGVGNSMDALMRSLEGDMSARFGKGELLGLDLVGMVRNLDPSYVGAGQSTIFDGLSGSFAVAGGVARGDDLKLDARLLTAAGQGAVDLGGQSLDYRLRPTLLEGATGGGLTVPLIISGPWAAPRFQLDLKALAEEEFADEIEAVKAQGEAAILKKVEEETGIKAETLGELEEKATEELGNRVEEAIENEVGNALGGLFNR